MFSLKTSPSFSSSQLRGFFAVHLSAFERLTFLSGLSVGSTKPISKRFPFGGVDLAFDVVFKSAGSIVIPVLSLMGETK